MRSHVNAEHAARLRAARAAEDAALAVVTARADAVERARSRRAQTLARYDDQVDAAKADWAEAVAALVRVAGLDRAAFALDMSRGQLRRLLPTNKARATPPIQPAVRPDGTE